MSWFCDFYVVSVALCLLCYCGCFVILSFLLCFSCFFTVQLIILFGFRLQLSSSQPSCLHSVITPPWLNSSPAFFFVRFVLVLLPHYFLYFFFPISVHCLCACMFLLHQTWQSQRSYNNQTQLKWRKDGVRVTIYINAPLTTMRAMHSRFDLIWSLVCLRLISVSNTEQLLRVKGIKIHAQCIIWTV